MTDTESSGPKVVSIVAAKKASERKWGALAMKPGFNLLPSVLFRGQKRLGLSNVQLVLLAHLADFWWSEDSVPWPKKETLAQRMNLTDKQIQRIAKSLEIAGFLTREKRVRAHGQTSNGYNLAGLVKKLNEIAPDFIEAGKAKDKVEKPGHRIKKAAGN